MERAASVGLRGRASRQRKVPRPSSELNLDHLRRRFTELRRRRPRQARVPDDLRAEVLAALDGGVTQGQLRKTCGVSTSQVRDWRQARARAEAASRGRAASSARVFSVVDVPVAGEAEAARQTHRAQELELRLGGWSISLRHEGP